MARNTQPYTLFTAQAANGNSDPIFVKDFRNAIIQWGTAGSFDGVLRVKGAIGETAPDFTAAASQSNQWEYTQIADIQSGDLKAGDTGIVSPSGIDEVRMIEVNTNGLDYIALELSSYVAGSVTATCLLTDND